MSSSEETRLRDDLRDIVQAGAPALDLDEIEQRGRREQRRAVAFRSLAAVGVAGVAVAGTLIAIRHPGPAGPAPVALAPSKTAASQPVSTGTPQLDNVAYVRQQVDAVQDPVNSVVEMKESGIDAGNPPETVWTDPATSSEMMLWSSSGGKVATWQSQYLDSHRVINVDDTQVNYGPRTWSYRTENFGSPISGPAPTAPVDGVSYIPAASVKTMLATGFVKIVGHPVVNGQSTVELSVALGKQGKAEINYFYVDSQTFRLVRLVRVFAPDSAHPASSTSDYTWVRRTPALTRLINHPQIPAGFAQVAPGS
ncbi:MAG TPA: hypothetical protein VMU95_16650 [Trebonia sp.]|nr:hypothetical protein [Trebonia sp.]